MTSFLPAHSPFEESGPAFADLREAAAKAAAGQRLDRRDAEALYYKASLPTLAGLAHQMRLRLHPEPVVTYVGDRNINYSNICVCGCRFCRAVTTPICPWSGTKTCCVGCAPTGRSCTSTPFPRRKFFSGRRNSA